MQALHHEAIISLLSQLCAGRGRSRFFSALFVCFVDINKMPYSEIRRTMCKELCVCVIIAQ